MSFWIFLLWMALGIALAAFLVRFAYLRLPSQSRRKRLRYLQPYTPAPAAAPAISPKGTACD